LAFRAHRLVTGLAWGCALLLGAALTSCAAPRFTYITDSGNSTYFKVPFGWQQVTPADLCTELEAATNTSTCPTNWSTAYEAEHQPSASGFLAGDLNRPFVYSEVTPYTSTSTPLTTETLEDFFLPVTTQAQEEEAEDGFPLTDFKSLRDDTLTLSQGYHGIRETFDYTYPGGVADTFDEVVLTNTAATTIYLLVLHCTTSCYDQYRTAISDVMSSFTVRSL
jgi:hypothetical protein